MAIDAKSDQLMELLRIHRKDPAAKRRLMVIHLSREGILTAIQIAERLHIARSTVFAYRRLYLEKGVEGLLARLSAGRPAQRPSPALERIIVSGLRLLRWFSVPTLREWIYGHDRLYPAWTVSRWAHSLIKRFKIKFPLNWEDKVDDSYLRWAQSVDKSRDPRSCWGRMQPVPDTTELSLGLVVEDSPGLRPWFSLAA